MNLFLEYLERCNQKLDYSLQMCMRNINVIHDYCIVTIFILLFSIDMSRDFVNRKLLFGIPFQPIKLLAEKTPGLSPKFKRDGNNNRSAWKFLSSLHDLQKLHLFLQYSLILLFFLSFLLHLFLSNCLQDNFLLVAVTKRNCLLSLHLSEFFSVGAVLA